MVGLLLERDIVDPDGGRAHGIDLRWSARVPLDMRSQHRSQVDWFNEGGAVVFLSGRGRGTFCIGGHGRFL